MVEILPESHLCIPCNGTGLAGGSFCLLCAGTGYVSSIGLGLYRKDIKNRVTALETKMADIEDKVDDILDKCNDIFEKVSE